jgi:hypothetical protein
MAARSIPRRSGPAPHPNELVEHERFFGSEALQTGMVIAAAIGPAIGVSAQAGEIGLATVLIIVAYGGA